VVINTIKYFLKEGTKNVWANGMMSLTSILVMACCLLLTGVSVLLSVNIRNILKNIETKNSITVYLKNDVTSSDISMIQSKITSTPNVISCEYYPREEAVKEYKEMLGELFEVLQGDENPLPDVFRVSMEELAQYTDTVSDIKSIEGVESISDRSNTAEKLTELNKLISLAGFWIIVALGGVSLFIVSNTIKVAMHNRRFEISIMKSVGATNWFIRLPFLIEGVIIGVVSALFSVLILNLSYNKLITVINDIIPFRGIPFEKLFWPVSATFLAAGIIFGLTGGLISITRYLKKEGGEVVAW
jgi:cell division transport system permease protein